MFYRRLQELQKLREGTSAPETPRTQTSRRIFFGRNKSTALERDALAAQVQQLEEQVQKLTERRVELERVKVKLEGQLTEATQEARSARAEKSTIEAKVHFFSSNSPCSVASLKSPQSSPLCSGAFTVDTLAKAILPRCFSRVHF